MPPQRSRKPQPCRRGILRAFLQALTSRLLEPVPHVSVSRELRHWHKVDGERQHHVLRYTEASRAITPKEILLTSTTHTRRNPRIEVLRLVAVLAIAIFHTFQTWFSAATGGTWDPSAPTLWLLGCTSLLGAYGNHVFYLISGMFLLPQATRDAPNEGYWSRQLRSLGRRIATIAITVVLYALVALAVSTWIVPLEGVSIGETSWLIEGLEFIWVYLVLVAIAPLVGKIFAALPHHDAIVGILTVVVFIINGYIAFVSPGNEVRSLLEWRKLMSAVSYLIAFLVGGVIGERKPASRKHARIGLVLTIAVCAIIEAIAAGTDALDVLEALSYKSTSLLSFALAVASLVFAASTNENGANNAHPRASEAAIRLAQGTLGFYVAQSMSSSLWRASFETLCASALEAGGEPAFLIAGVLLSVALVAIMLIVDVLVRVPILRKLGLAR